MKMKKLTAGLCALAVTMGVAAAPAESIVPAVKSAIVASAADNETYGNLYYRVVAGEVHITGVKEGSTEVNIPDRINGKPVTVIENNAFNSVEHYNIDLYKVTIGNNVKTIESFAFWGQANVTALSLPSSLRTVEGYCHDNLLARMAAQVYAKHSRSHSAPLSF